MNYLQIMHVQIIKQQWQNVNFQQMMMNIRIEIIIITSTFIFSNSSHKKSKTRLFKIELYNEKNLVLYFQFIFKIRAKLFIDKKTISDEKNQLWYAFNFLNNKTADRIHFWIKIVSSPSYTKKFTLKAFLRQIKMIFLDSTRVAASERNSVGTPSVWRRRSQFCDLIPIRWIGLESYFEISF